MSKPTAQAILQAGLGHMQDRAATYDKPEGERSMGATVEAFNAVTGLNLTTEQGWLFQILLKAVRSQQGGFRLDTYEDGAAYFGLMGEAAADARMPKEVGVDSRGPIPENEFDEARVDRVASSHGDGEHYSESHITRCCHSRGCAACEPANKGIQK